jgi:hypothetical protein
LVFSFFPDAGLRRAFFSMTVKKTVWNAPAGSPARKHESGMTFRNGNAAWPHSRDAD